MGGVGVSSGAAAAVDGPAADQDMDGKRPTAPEDDAAAVRVSCPDEPPELNRSAARVLLRILVSLADSDCHPFMSSRQGAA